MHQTIAYKHLRRLAHGLLCTALDLVFPAQCVGCGRVGDLFCAACLDALRTPPLSLTAPYLNGLYAAGEFKGVWRHAIHAFKYEGQKALADLLAGLLPCPPELPETVIIVPVPLHPNRQRWRGYNQATLLAQALAVRLDRDMVEDALVRLRDTRPQVGLNAAARRRNMKGAFSAPRDLVNGRDIVLVDDVFTTGATLSSGAEALRRAGATAVWALALACAPGHHDLPLQDRAPVLK